MCVSSVFAGEARAGCGHGPSCPGSLVGDPGGAGGMSHRVLLVGSAQPTAAVDVQGGARDEGVGECEEGGGGDVGGLADTAGGIGSGNLAEVGFLLLVAHLVPTARVDVPGERALTLMGESYTARAEARKVTAPLVVTSLRGGGRASRQRRRRRRASSQWGASGVRGASRAGARR